MKAKVAIGLLGVCAFAATCGAWTKHYSFSGGYPANGGTSSGAAKAVENGGASMTMSARTRSRVVSAEKSIVGRVTKVTDGDTLTVTPNGGRGTKVRMRRIDAPEADQPCGDKATAFLKELVGGKDVEVKYAERDDHGRVLGTVFMKVKGENGGDGEKGERGGKGESGERGGKGEKLVDVNLTMILNGWAWHYYSFKKNDKFAPYDKAEQAARNAKIGLWAEENPIRPYDWRKSRGK